MHDVTVIDDPAAAEASLDPIRARLLAELAQPGSASSLADRVGLTRQKANYHLRALERHGLEFATFNDVERRRLDSRAPAAQIHIEGKLDAGQISGEGKAVEIGTINVDNSSLDDDAQGEPLEVCGSRGRPGRRRRAATRPAAGRETCLGRDSPLEVIMSRGRAARYPGRAGRGEAR